MLSMQNRDGGWGAFDRDNNLSLLNHIPFADHNAMLDPSTADVTARAIECLGQMGWAPSEPAVQRAGTLFATINARTVRGTAAGESTTSTDPAGYCGPWRHCG